MYGSAGTGKTLILFEGLKIKVSKLRSQGRRVRILATTFDDDRTTELLNNFTNKYLVNMKNIEVMGLEKLCSELNIKYDFNTPRDTINRVITSLSVKYPDDVTILLVDEVDPCGSEQTRPDWRHLKVRENVIWLLGLAPRTLESSSPFCQLNPSLATLMFEVLPPIMNNPVLTRHLIIKHRNCPQIRYL